MIERIILPVAVERSKLCPFKARTDTPQPCRLSSVPTRSASIDPSG
jgi:hypothetical protein